MKAVSRLSEICQGLPDPAGGPDITVNYGQMGEKTCTMTTGQARMLPG